MNQNNNTNFSRPARPMGGPMGRGPGGMGMPVEKPKDFKGTMAKLLAYLKTYKKAIITVIIFALLSTVFTIFGPKILGKAITKLFEGAMVGYATGVMNIDFDYISKCVIILLGLYLLSAAFSYIQGWIMSGVSMKVTYRLRKDIFQKINKLPLKYFDNTTHGEVLSRLTNDVDTVSQTLNQSLSQMITSCATIIGVLIMMFSISWLMTLVTVLILPLSMIIMMKVIKRSQVYFKKQQEYLGHINGHVEEMYGGHTVMKAFNGEEDSQAKFDEYNNVLYGASWRSQFLSGLIMPIMIFVGNLGYVAVCILGGVLAVLGSIAVGDIQAFIQYVRYFNQPISQIATISNTLQSTVAASERVFAFLEEEEEKPEIAKPITPTDIKGVVTFKEVRFGYKEDKMVIHNFSATINPGQKVAIVGPTGAGKTTIVKLLMRFYDINAGEILIDDNSIYAFSRYDLRQMFGMVLQDTWLSNNTIMENIRYGRLDATDEEVVAAGKAAYADKFIRTLNDGYQMVINEEASNMSQGQKQLITIARAILANPKILILDEATSSVDTRTELLIQKAMANLMKDRTSFIIAHRLSTIRDADLILVMDDGDIVEQGNHQELLAAGGFYARLYASQFEKAEAS